MKLIGRTTDGGHLVEIGTAEYVELLAAAGTLSKLPALMIAPSAETPVAKLVFRRAVKPHVEKNTHETKRCLVCKKTLTGLSTVAKTHEGACKKEYARQYAQRHYQQGRVVKPAAETTGVTSNQPITNQEREKLLAERLAGIRARQP